MYVNVAKRGKNMSEGKYRNESKSVTYLLVGLAGGALMAFFFDPQKGRRRRALLRDQWVELRNDTLWYTGKQMRNLNNHVQGWIARVANFFKPEEIPDDETLVQRVRSVMGRKVRHPHSIEVIAENGRVTLRGLILADEVQEVFDCVRRVRGVTHVKNELEVHSEPGNIPGLQGEGKIYLRH